MRRLEFHEEAFREIEEAESYYANEAPQIVPDFRQAINESLDRIRIDPDSYPYLVGKYRALRVSRFPYLLCYRSINDSLITVVAVVHTSRKPGYWTGREQG